MHVISDRLDELFRGKIARPARIRQLSAVFLEFYVCLIRSNDVREGDKNLTLLWTAAIEDQTSHRAELLKDAPEKALAKFRVYLVAAIRQRAREPEYLTFDRTRVASGDDIFAQLLALHPVHSEPSIVQLRELHKRITCHAIDLFQVNFEDLAILEKLALQVFVCRYFLQISNKKCTRREKRKLT